MSTRFLRRAHCVCTATGSGLSRCCMVDTAAIQYKSILKAIPYLWEKEGKMYAEVLESCTTSLKNARRIDVASDAGTWQCMQSQKGNLHSICRCPQHLLLNDSLTKCETKKSLSWLNLWDTERRNYRLSLFYPLMTIQSVYMEASFLGTSTLDEKKKMSENALS